MRPAADSQPEEEDLVGSVLAGRYRIVSLIGAGGMGSVYRAEHVHMRKAVAVKVLHREMTAMPEVVARFEREAVAAARIEHPNVAAATDFGRLDNGSFYLALEFIEGRSLAALMKAEGTLDEARALRIARQIADALAAAHAAGIVHRDLKPDNVMLVAREQRGDFVKVLDFGIAKVKLDASADQPLTQMGMVFGTPEYMSPEQARGLDVDARSDLYALGLILYEMLGGTSPFRHEDLVAVLTRQITMDPDPLPETVSAGTSELVKKLLRKDPAERVQTAAEVREILESLLATPLTPQLGSPPSGVTPVGTAAPAMNLIELADGRTAIALPALAHGPIRVLLAWVKRLGLNRRLRVGRYALPLGAALGLSLLVSLAIGLTVLLLTVHPSAVAPEAAAPPRPQDPDLLALVASAEAGEDRAIVALSAREPAKRSLVEWRALGHGYCRTERPKQCLEVYAEGVARHPELGSETSVLADIRKLGDRIDVAGDVLTLAARSLGAAGADLLFDIAERGKGGAATTAAKARALLDEEPAKGHTSASLRALLLLQAAMKKPKCNELKLLLPDIARDVDERALSLLGRLSERRGCGIFGLSDCYGCLRANSELPRALEAARTHPRPSFGVREVMAAPGAK